MNKPIPLAPLPKAEAERVEAEPTPVAVAPAPDFDPESFDSADPVEQEMAPDTYIPFEELESFKEESENEPLPDLKEVEDRVPEKTKALMEELFRARLDMVKRIDRKRLF
ncbi:MAG: hypothetical protein AAGB46_04200 [Verrucomicrobiota bacterium]